MPTDENLKAAFGDESKASNKYLAFANKAEEDGFPGIAKLFRAVATAEAVHALNYMKKMEMIKGTEDNLKTAISSESYENSQMYPAFIQQANDESRLDVAKVFNFAKTVEKIHENLFRKALEKLSMQQDLQGDFFVCQVCGNTVEGQAPNLCHVCGALKEQFIKIQ